MCIRANGIDRWAERICTEKRACVDWSGHFWGGTSEDRKSARRSIVSARNAPDYGIYGLLDFWQIFGKTVF
jgi:hypothetical protein